MDKFKRNPMLPIILIFAMLAINSLLRGGYSNPMDWLMENI